MTTRIVQSQNQFAVLLPREIVEGLGLRDGSVVDLELENGTATLRATSDIAQITDEDRRFVERAFAEDEPVFRALAK